MKYFTKIILFLLLSGSLMAQGYDETFSGDDVMDYESIVRELSTPGQSKVSYYGPDPLSMVRFHIGVGFTNSLVSISDSDRKLSLQAPMKGVSARFGVDLFNPSWRAEGGIATYETYDDSETGARIGLKEFDLSVVSLTKLTRLWSYKFGGGLSARYLDINTENANPIEYNTPALAIQTGFLADIGKSFSISTDLHYRKSMVQETADKSALDFMLRLDGHF